IAAGGCANGGQLAAVLAMGGAGVSMGTRFVTTKESSWHQSFKNKAVEFEVTDTILSDKFDGIPLRRMATERAIEIVNSRLNPMSALMNSFQIARELEIPYHKLFWRVMKAGPKQTINYMRMSHMLKDQH